MDGVDGRGAAEGGGGAFGKAEVAHFARVHGGGHGGNDGLDGDFAVETVAGGVVSVGFDDRRRKGATNQYQRSTWSVCSLLKLSSMAFRIYSGSLLKMRVPSANPLTANFVARNTFSFS